MRGTDKQQSGMFSYISAERRVATDHPLRAIRAMVEVALRNMGPQFETMYAKVGRRSIPPEKLLRALLLQVLYTVRSERMLMEQLDYNLLFRWFVGLNIRSGVGCNRLHQKSRAALARRNCPDLLCRGAGAGPPPRPALDRALHGRRHADRSVGESQKLQAQGPRW